MYNDLEDKFENKINDMFERLSDKMVSQFSDMTVNMIEKFSNTALVSVENYNAKFAEAISEKFESRMNLIEGYTRDLSSGMADMKCNIDKISDRIEKYERDTELTTEQVDEINSHIKYRILGLIGEPGSMERDIYCKGFSYECRSDIRRDLNTPYKIARIKRVDYDRVIEYVDSWRPKEGITALKEKLDKKNYVIDIKIKLLEREAKRKEYLTKQLA